MSTEYRVGLRTSPDRETYQMINATDAEDAVLQALGSPEAQEMYLPDVEAGGRLEVTVRLSMREQRARRAERG